MNGPRRSSLALYALAAVGLVLSLWLHLRLGDMGFDDTWIHLRIARDLLATGHAWFNTDERVMATSSPLWTLLMAALHVPAHPRMLPVLEALVLWGSSVLAFRITRDCFAVQSNALGNPDAQPTLTPQHAARTNALALLAALLTATLLLPSSIGQMETPLALLLLLDAWHAATTASPSYQAGGHAATSLPSSARSVDAFATSPRNSAAGAHAGLALPLLALAACTRLELLPLWLLATAAALVWSRRHRLAAIEGAAIVAIMSAWTFAQFHVLLPNSMRAKQISYDFTLAQTAQQFLGLRVRDTSLLLLLLAVLATALHRYRTRRAEPRAWQVLLPVASALSGSLVVAEYITRRTVLFEWYRPLYLVPLALGILLLVPIAWRSNEPSQSRTAPPRSPAWVAFAAAQAVLLLWLVAPAAQLLPRYLRGAVHPTVAGKSQIDGGDYVRVQEYLQVGTVLEQTCPNARVLASEIGGLGDTFRGTLLDGFGIASPAALRYQPLRSGAPKGGIPAAYVLQAEPDVVVSYTVMAYELMDNPVIAAQYQLVQLPTSPRSHRGGLLDIAWRSSPHLDVWLRRTGLCNRTAVTQALHAQLD